MNIQVFSDGALQSGDLTMTCALGRGGTARDKKEGDGATPLGCFPLRRVLFRPDRLAAPATNLLVAPLSKGDAWCDDPEHPEYNQPVKLPFDGRHENLWRDDNLYDLIVILGHNDDPPVPYKGSAIFMHVARPGFAPTEGCIALCREDLETVLRRAGPGDQICITEAVAAARK